MLPRPEETTIYDEVSVSLKNISEANPKSLAAQCNSDDQTKKDLVPLFEKIVSLCQAFKDENFQSIPAEILKNNIDPILSSIIKYVPKEPVRKVKLSSPDEAAKIKNEVAKIYTEAYLALTPFITYLRVQNLNKDRIDSEIKNYFDTHETEVNKLYKKFDDEIKELTQKKESTIKEISSLTLQLKNLAQQAGVSQHAIYFQGEAASHQKKAMQWVGLTILLACITICFGLWGHHLLPNIDGATLTPTYITQVLAPRATVLFILVYMIVWSAKNQKANNHNYIVNKHRQNALSTFQVFAESGSNPEVKNAILLQSTQCIFSPQNSGYSSIDNEPDISNKIIEIIKPSVK